MVQMRKTQSNTLSNWRAPEAVDRLRIKTSLECSMSIVGTAAGTSRVPIPL